MENNAATPAPLTLEDALRLIEKLSEENALLHLSLDKLRRIVFGSSSEKLKPSDLPVTDVSVQQDLFDEEAVKAIPAVATKEKISYERIKPQKDGHGRRVIPDTIRRNDIIVDISEEEKTCACGCEKKHIGEETSEELDFVPAHLIVNRIIRPKYVCPKCPDKGVDTAPPPSRIIPKSLGTPALYAHIMTSKFRWHLPLYRQEKMFDHYGLAINRSVMCGWEKQLLPYLELVYDEMKIDLLHSRYIQTDETTLPVLDKSKPGKVHNGYLWPYTNGASILFEYQSGRSRSGPLAFLNEFKGYLQSDGYGVYESIAETYKDSITHFVCWAHARRELYQVRESDQDYILPILMLIRRLYALEARMKKWKIPEEGITKLRNRIATRYLASIKERLDACPATHTPKSVVRKAVNYVLNRWGKLLVYCQCGLLQIDNNRIENAIRPIALGRKNWMFAGSEDGAKKLAVIYSIINTCLMLGIDPEHYLADIFSRIHDYPHTKIRELIPAEWLNAKNNPSLSKK